MGIPTGWELILLLGVLVLLFGATKLPTAARSIGQSMRIFKAETKGMRSDDEEEEAAQGGGRQTSQQQPSQSPQAGQPPQQSLPPAGPAVAAPIEETQRGRGTSR
ncbi:MAG: Sec-independent protein translocase subunit TatA [Pseudonocardiaceae bacterium]